MRKACFFKEHVTKRCVQNVYVQKVYAISVCTLGLIEVYRNKNRNETV